MTRSKIIPVAALLAMCTLAVTAQNIQKENGPSFITGFSFKEYALDQPASGPAIVAVDEDDTVWVALAKAGKLARFMNNTVRLFNIGSDSRPVGIAVGTNNNGQAGFLWIAASYDNKIIRFDTATGKTKEYSIDGENSWPFNIAIAPNGIIWFTERASSHVGMLDPVSGKVKHFEIATPNAGPAGLAVDQKTGTVWFTESYADRIGRLDPTTGSITEMKMSDTSTGLVSGPAGLAIDSNGGIWFAKLEGKLGYIAPPYTQISLRDVPSEAKRPAGITVSATGDVWAVALDGNALLCYKPIEGTFKIFPIPTGEPDSEPRVPPFAKTSRPFGIAADAEGNIWFSEQYTGQLGVLNIAAPSLEVFSPRGTVRTLDPLLTVRSTDHIFGVQKLTLMLDSAPPRVNHGRLDFRGLMPGQHLLTVTVVGPSGQASETKVQLDYAPGNFVLAGMLRELRPRNPDGSRVQAELIEQCEALPKGDIAAGIGHIRELLQTHADSFDSFDRHLFAALLDYQLAHGGHSVAVSILDSPPYFSTPRLTIHKGDTIVWKYDPPSDGHSISHELHGIEIASAKTKSAILRAGESFSFKFDATGEFSIVDTQHPEAHAVVFVEQ